MRTFAIYLAAAWSGFYVMGVELLGGRLLAPFFGSSVFVWGAIITVFMMCLSLGYLLGGQLSLFKPTLAILCALLVGEAITSMPIIALGSIAWEWISYRMPDPRYGSLLGALLMFGMPTVIAGMVSPYAVRLLIGDIEASGKSAGRLYFVSTFGSAAGTVLTAFYLVAWLPINTIILTFIGITLVVGIATWLAGVRNVKLGSQVGGNITRVKRSGAWDRLPERLSNSPAAELIAAIKANSDAFPEMCPWTGCSLTFLTAVNHLFCVMELLGELTFRRDTFFDNLDLYKIELMATRRDDLANCIPYQQSASMMRSYLAGLMHYNPNKVGQQSDMTQRIHKKNVEIVAAFARDEWPETMISSMYKNHGHIYRRGKDLILDESVQSIDVIVRPFTTYRELSLAFSRRGMPEAASRAQRYIGPISSTSETNATFDFPLKIAGEGQPHAHH
jgi:hypothetical protein